MKQTIMILTLLLALAFGGCSDNKAKDIYETAKLEELQNNPEHARQLYREIIEKYPESQYAQTAEERLDALEK